MAARHVVVDGSNIAHRRPYDAQPGAAGRSRAGLPRRVPRHRGDGRRRRHVRPPDRPLRGGRVRGGRGRQRGRVAARGRHRPRRRVPAPHRRQDRRDRAVQRLVPGVPRRARLALRRGPADRRQAGARGRLDLHAADAGAWADQPPRHRRREARRKGRSASSAPRAAAASAKQVTAAINAQRGGAAPKIGDSLAVAPEPAKAARRSSSSSSKRKAAAAPAPAAHRAPGPGRNRRSTGTREPANQPLPFIEFVGSHPVGSAVTAEVERFSSHGAYVRVDDLLCYVPLKSMGDPAAATCSRCVDHRRSARVHRATLRSASPWGRSRTPRLRGTHGHGPFGR